MKYYDDEGCCYKVDAIGIGADHKMNHGVTCTDREGKETNVISIVPQSAKIEVENELAKYAKENGLIPELIYQIKQGDRVLQGKIDTVNDFIKIDDTAKAQAFDKYLGHKNKILSLESEKASKIEQIKKEYKEMIEAEEDAMDSIESEARNGTVKQECQASWERDLENGAMLLIRHDNLKVLQWRKMTEQEAQVSIDDLFSQDDSE